jgi:plasmid stabilization system protein ParE
VSFILSPEAAQDLDDIWEYIAEDSLDAADRFLGKLYGQILALGDNPAMGHTREDLVDDRPLLFWPVGNYLILYRSTQGIVEIVAVTHGRRDIPSFIRRRYPTGS